jgi:hypothetical protein
MSPFAGHVVELLRVSDGKYPLLIQIWRQRDDRTILLDRESLFEIVSFTLEILLLSLF